MQFIKSLTLGFGAGAVGGLLNAIVLWLLVFYNIAAALGIHYSVPITHHGIAVLLYHQITWGGIWGLLFGCAIMPSASWWKRGLVLGLLPSIVVLFYIAPFVSDMGFFAKDHGDLTFILVLVVNWIWGLVGAIWYHAVK